VLMVSPKPPMPPVTTATLLDTMTPPLNDSSP
jgi:hypothetical protein